MIYECEKLYLREATEEDVDLLFVWANDELTRKNSFNEDKIAYEDHKVWFKNLLRDENKYQLILMHGQIAVGQIRLSVDLDCVAEIGYAVAPSYRGRGFGKIILALTLVYAKENVPNLKKVVGKVKSTNVASYRAFVDNGFEEKYRLLEIDMENYELDL